ncbi:MULTISPECIES: prephenate dehydratase [Sphingomonas]|jgi:prephenate dehydratase|uniref:prephenate dehydratase n=1 Tax=Sphingomonas hankookensis TaxID=563996 RepID=A0ABR5YC49_9SPHN|nr:MULTISPECIES: prephenate dehydratase [Sphingomonas]KZE15002.1 prephenate dehydratase [Sphingomonas hankookensis]PZT94523.1 MAG: prephenate dehydratase [Sphingomonas sp.]RSV25563.1 prephenate dehydratase [Sphingomonas sp. ABOLH]WCP72551.1 prephenate dehydratase [Sphingomonas hankookensis]
MQKYAAPARPLVAQMIEAAARDPNRTVAFQGAPGANSHVALTQAFPDGLPLPCFGFADAIDAVRVGQADCAIIPIENSLHGRVADMHFLLPESGLVITGEHFLPIRHALMGLGPVEGIRQAMSHEQALGQCRHWLSARGIEPVAHPDTAGAAASVAAIGDPTVAALAPPAAAELYGLQLLADDIADADHNTTRFVVLARAAPPELPEGPCMTTLVFEVKNLPAALYKAMGGFATNGVNMTKLESYQRGGTFAATEFFCDIEGRPGEPHVDRALDELRFHSKWVRLLGSYGRARERG